MQERKSNFKKVRREDMEVMGNAMAVKVVHNQIEPAIKLWKRKLKDSGILEQLKERKEFIKPSAVKRKQKEEAIRAEWRRRKFDN
jgi:small subunit ribosomal protein S21